MSARLESTTAQARPSHAQLYCVPAGPARHSVVRYSNRRGLTALFCEHRFQLAEFVAVTVRMSFGGLTPPQYGRSRAFDCQGIALCPKAASGRAEQVADALSALATDTQAQELVKAADETDAEMAETTMYE
jgi:hypothetical protein